jgi:hypothetical protein
VSKRSFLLLNLVLNSRFLQNLKISGISVFQAEIPLNLLLSTPIRDPDSFKTYTTLKPSNSLLYFELGN